MKALYSRMLVASLVAILYTLPLHVLHSQVSVDTAFIDDLYNKSKTFWYTNRDSSIFYLKLVEKLSKELNYTRGSGYANYGLGKHEPVLYRRFQYLTSALDLFESSNDQLGEAITLTLIGDVYFILGEYEKSREYTLRSLTIKKELDDYGGMALCYINLGRDYQRRHLYKEALENYNEALVYRLKEGRQQGVAYAQVNMADVYFETGKYEASLSLAKKASSNFLPSKDATGIIWAKLITGCSYLKLNEVDSAKSTLEAVVNNNFGVQYDDKVNQAKKNLISIYKNHNDLEKAFILQTQYITTHDTLDSWNRNIEAQRLANEYEFKMAEKEALQQRQQESIEIARRNTIEYLIIAVIVVLFFIILFSGRKWLKGNLVKVFTFIGLLLLFEFLLVVTDPLVENLTRGEPLLKLLANIILALLIFPCHRLLETFTKKRLIVQ